MSPVNSANKVIGSPTYVKSKMSPYKLILLGKKEKNFKEDIKKKPIQPYSNSSAVNQRTNMV
jgi:hypothetical protein